MVYEVTVIQEFAAAHHLEHYEGNCNNIHGHTWRVEIVLIGSQLDEAGMLVDFRAVKKVLQEIIIRDFDHKYLNEISPFNKINPTAENIARVIYEKAEQMLEDCEVKMVRVWESPTACAAYKGVGQ